MKSSTGQFHVGILQEGGRRCKDIWSGESQQNHLFFCDSYAKKITELRILKPV